MKQILAAVCLTLAMSGCGMFEPLRSQPTAAVEDPITAEARRVIDEGFALVTASNRAITANKRAGVWTDAQAKPYEDESIAARRMLNEARNLLRRKLPRDAQAQAELVRTALLSLQARIAAEARKKEAK